MQRIGIDFDNTIAGYDRAFSIVAKEWRLIPEGFNGGKKSVKDFVISKENGETSWQRLQGCVYGKGMPYAELIDGVDSFLRECRARNITVLIVSHKTEFGHFDPEKVNLRDAAWAWLREAGFFDNDGFGISEESVFFEPTREDKIRRIRSLECDCFIDDLEDVFREPTFPLAIQRYLFSPGAGPQPKGPFRTFRSWADIYHEVFNVS